jgi:hypothetical protein
MALGKKRGSERELRLKLTVAANHKSSVQLERADASKHVVLLSGYTTTSSEKSADCVFSCALVS